MNLKYQPLVVCIGASLIDLNFRYVNKPEYRSSNPSRLFRSPGGVVRNIAHHLALLGNKVELISIFGMDSDGDWLNKVCHSAGIGTSNSVFLSRNTGTYASFISTEGELIIGAVEDTINDDLDIPLLVSKADIILSADLVLADCNLSPAPLKWLISYCDTKGIPLVIETVSVTKSQRLIKALPGKILMIKPNEDEIQVFRKTNSMETDNDRIINELHELGVQYVWLSLASKGSFLSVNNKNWSLKSPDVKIVDSSGAGDAATAGWIHAWLRDKDPLQCMKAGHALAAAVLESSGAVREDLTPNLLKSYLDKIWNL
jgi:pseudouridine kinase